MDPLLLRDSLSMTGVRSHGSSMAVGGQGQLIFKKSDSELTYYDNSEHSITSLRLSKKDPLYSDCQIFDFCYVRGGNLLIVLQRKYELYICEGIVDPQEQLVDISGTVHKTKISIRKGMHVELIHDEVGVVIVSYPITWKEEGNVVELLHASNYLQARAGDKYTISLSCKQNLNDVTLNSAFISRNYLYLFFAGDFTRFLLVPLAGTNCGRCEVRTTQGAPLRDYMNKSVLAFEDFILIYAWMSVKNTDRPNLFLLNLQNLRWIDLTLALSHHYPNSKVSFQKGTEELVYLHGDCHVSGCAEKSHLYQINVEAISALLMTRVRSQSFQPHKSSVSSLPAMVRRSSSISQGSLHSPTTNGTAPFTTNSAPTKLSEAPTMRYKKNTKDNNYKHRYSHCKSIHDDEDYPKEEKMKRSPSSSSIHSAHWGADMAEQSETSLKEQMKTAIDMGFTQQAILEAFNRKENGDIVPFESVNSMLDVLQKFSGRGASDPPKMRLSLYEESPKSTNGSRNGTVIRRSPSLHSSPNSSRYPEIDRQKDLTRVINALEQESRRDKKEYGEQFTILKSKIHDLETEIDRLSVESEEKSKLLILKEGIESQLTSSKQKVEELGMENIRLMKDLAEQKELAEYRKKLREEDSETLHNDLRKVESNLQQTVTELTNKKALLDEQTAISKRLEEEKNTLMRNCCGQTSDLLTNICQQSSEILRSEEEFEHKEEQMLMELIGHRKQMINKMKQMEVVYEEVRRKIPMLEEQLEKQREEYEKQIKTMEDNNTNINMQFRLLAGKSSAECCICLTNKPNVVFQPCRHLVVCSDCSQESSLTECPTCRSNITDTLIVFS